MRLNLFRKKTIVIIYASIGSGHKMAAEAIRESITSMAPEIKINLVDVLTFSKSEFLRLMPSKVSIGSKIVSLVYDYLWGKKDVGLLTQRATGLIRDNFEKLERYLLKTNPAAIVTTHALASLLISEYKKSKTLSCPHFSILTDFRSNQIWPVNNVDYYFASTIPAFMDLVKTGIKPHKVAISGIPLRKQFLAEGSKKVKGNNPGKVLFIAGGENSSPYENIAFAATKLIKKVLPLTSKLTIVCGNNRLLKRKLEREFLKNRFADSLTLIGFEKDMATLINKHDLIITKPGGLISAEIVFLNKPIIIFGESYGQERANAAYLINNGLAIQVKTTKELVFILKAVFDKKLYSQITSNLKHSPKPQATMLITKRIIRAVNLVS